MIIAFLLFSVKIEAIQTKEMIVPTLPGNTLFYDCHKLSRKVLFIDFFFIVLP
jgi:hypothetical protein